MKRRWLGIVALGMAGLGLAAIAVQSSQGLPVSRAVERHLLYVAVPGIRNYVEWGGVRFLV